MDKLPHAYFEENCLHAFLLEQRRQDPRTRGKTIPKTPESDRVPADRNVLPRGLRLTD